MYGGRWSPGCPSQTDSGPRHPILPTSPEPWLGYHFGKFPPPLPTRSGPGGSGAFVPHPRKRPRCSLRPQHLQGEGWQSLSRFQRPRSRLKPGSFQSSSGVRRMAPFSRLSLPSTTYISGSFPQSTDCSFLSGSLPLRATAAFTENQSRRSCARSSTEIFTKGTCRISSSRSLQHCLGSLAGKTHGGNPHMEDIPLPCLIAREFMLACRH